MSSSLTVEQLLCDAKRLTSRLKEHDTSADSIISNASKVLKAVEAMRQFQEDLDALNLVAHNRPRTQLVLGFHQENRHIRQLQQENKELRAALEEHQNATEMIMSKYREQMTRMMTNSCNNNVYANDKKSSLLQEKTDKICEMASVMKQSILVDDECHTKEQELLSRLITENKGLREMLEISVRNGSYSNPIVEPRLVSTGVQTEELETLPRPVPLPAENDASSSKLLVSVSTSTTVSASSPLSPSPPSSVRSNQEIGGISSGNSPIPGQRAYKVSISVNNVTISGPEATCGSKLLNGEQEDEDSNRPISAASSDSSDDNNVSSSSSSSTASEEDDEISFNTIKRSNGPPRNPCSSSIQLGSNEAAAAAAAVLNATEMAAVENGQEDCPASRPVQGEPEGCGESAEIDDCIEKVAGKHEVLDENGLKDRKPVVGKMLDGQNGGDCEPSLVVKAGTSGGPAEEAVCAVNGENGHNGDDGSEGEECEEPGHGGKVSTMTATQPSSVTKAELAEMAS